MKNSNVFILYTGGTIGMAPSEKGNPASPLVPKPLEELVGWIPGWAFDKKPQDLGKGIQLPNSIKLGFESLEKPVDSSNITPEDWLDMAKRIEAVYQDYDGFVILHGTDTMAFTSSGLSFIFENLSKPVVITGSQLPISDERTDGVMNLLNSVQIAGWKSTGLPCIPEVVICFADKLLRGCRATKVSSTAWAGFDSPNFPHLGEIGRHIRIHEDLLRPMPDDGESFQINTSLNTNVMDFSLNPGMKVSQLETVTGLDGIDAVLLRTYGAGNAPDTKDYLKAIENITAKGKTIVNITQCTQGMVEMGLYSASVGMLERGVVSGLDMTPEAALAKLYWTLGTKTDEQIVTQMQISQRGEQSQNLFDLGYGKCGNSDETVEKFDHFVTPDRRFMVGRLSRSVVRFQGLGIKGINTGETAKIRVFMNKPGAKSDSPNDDSKCVASFEFTWDGKVVNKTHVIDELIPRGNLGQGGIALSVRADDGVSFWFEGLYLALFAKA